MERDFKTPDTKIDIFKDFKAVLVLSLKRFKRLRTSSCSDVNVQPSLIRLSTALCLSDAEMWDCSQLEASPRCFWETSR